MMRRNGEHRIGWQFKAPALRVLPIVLAGCMGISSGCGKDTLNGSAQTPPGQTATPTPAPASDPNAGLNVRKLAAAATSYAITYGALDTAAIETLKTYPLVIVHPYNGNITRSQIMQIKQGVKADDPTDNPVVLCYLSIGEDSRTFGLSDQQMKTDTRFAGDGSGPSIDPRAPGEKSLVLSSNQIKGTPTGGGFASYYLNDNAVRCKGAPDKSPDSNGNFDVRFVNAGDPIWYDTVNTMLMIKNPADPKYDTPPGLKELLTESYGRGLGCDGVFLDTIDTAAPNSYTSCTDVNQTASEWTAQGFTSFMRRLRGEYPGKVILQNRGLFFFDPRFPHYEVSARGTIDLGFFESYYLDNNSVVNFNSATNNGDPYASIFHLDNKYNTAPKIMAEANRPAPDGFKVLSLGYGDGFGGPKDGIDINTLLGTSSLGYDILKQDILYAQEAGFIPYTSNASVNLVNSFVKNNTTTADSVPPVWSSTYNANYDPPLPQTPRVGIQKAVATSPGSGSVTLSWDVALDRNRVSYVLYYQTTATPFDFASAARRTLTPTFGDGYNQVWNTVKPSEALSGVYPYQQTITGLLPGATYHFVIHAIDSAGNEDTNTEFIEVTL